MLPLRIELTSSSKAEDDDIVDAHVCEDALALSHGDQISRNQLAGNQLTETPSEAVLDCEVSRSGSGGRSRIAVVGGGNG